ncbi:hypothetical protein LSS_20915 [Leptospira santarosai serovar Shermani str. LT 821]|uniref:Uncharacterized protein n=1 Tax=Leptospira santarosai serovar Shermani str. LT 821 TaxID=758847 RepID=A0A097ESA6_9LEPT|nr:hypothetical protein LSS_20915 [Leptospira santarosai serovar Shermani str. LT 821]
MEDPSKKIAVLDFSSSFEKRNFLSFPLSFH